MRSFRTELENPVVEQDILELETRIHEFKNGAVDEEKFRSLRLARGVYGQRQAGVQMIRIKLPYGKVSARQLRRIAAVSDTYSNGKLHITTRQDLQIHYVDLERTPELWAELEKDEVTLREACGNTVRNVTASETAGIDPEEPFDVSPYAQAVFEYFLRNPIGQEMGRKFKVSFSAGRSDTGLSFMHDLGFIAKLQAGVRGFQVMIGGGLGAQPRHADLLYSFLPENRIIPLMEAVVRVFDRFGERKSRAKARLKYLVRDLGIEEFRKKLAKVAPSLPNPVFEIPYEDYPASQPVTTPVENLELRLNEAQAEIRATGDSQAFELWQKTNVIPQKQPGFQAVGVRVFLGNFTTDQARQLADLVETYGAGEVRLSLRQNILIPFIPEAWIPLLYRELQQIGLAAPGYNSAADITACPGTDTCNLGIASSTGIAAELERIIAEEYPHLLAAPDLVIKISGCMNACGQHTIAHIGFQGMSVRTPDKRVAPALQVLLGGGNVGEGNGRFADKVVKIPSKRGPQALRLILEDYLANGGGKTYDSYYTEQGQQYFYDFLRPLTDVSNLEDSDFVDWGNTTRYEKAIGVGECAGAIIDLVATLILEGKEKLQASNKAFLEGRFAAAIYYAYSAQIHTAKALLTAADVNTNTHAGILELFDTHLVDHLPDFGITSLKEAVLSMNEAAPDYEFARAYRDQASKFIEQAEVLREKQLSHV